MYAPPPQRPASADPQAQITSVTRSDAAMVAARGALAKLTPLLAAQIHIGALVVGCLVGKHLMAWLRMARGRLRKFGVYVIVIGCSWMVDICLRCESFAS